MSPCLRSLGPNWKEGWITKWSEDLNPEYVVQPVDYMPGSEPVG